MYKSTCTLLQIARKSLSAVIRNVKITHLRRTQVFVLCFVSLIHFRRCFKASKNTRDVAFHTWGSRRSRLSLHRQAPALVAAAVGGVVIGAVLAAVVVDVVWAAGDADEEQVWRKRTSVIPCVF